MNPSQVRDGLKTNLQTIAGLRVYELIPDTVTPPAAVVGQLDFTFDIENARGLDQAQVDVLVIVQRFSERSRTRQVGCLPCRKWLWLYQDRARK
jgi:hypothetical protein